MTKKQWIIVISSLICGVVLLVWVSNADERGLQANDLYTLIDAGETRIDLQTVAPFEWQQVNTFGPYSTSETIADAFNIELRPLFGGTDVSELEFLLVFVRDDKIVKKLYLSRKYGDYTVEDNRYLIVE